MYIKDHRFDTPSDQNTKIWRYINIEKYADMVKSHALYFSTGKKFQEEDPYEGSYLSFELLKSVPVEKAVEFARKMKSCGPPITLNCWHLNEFESLAMWRLYGDTVAIQSTVGRLVEALAKFPCDVRVGRVHYIVPGEDPFTSKSVDVFTPWLHKHRSFEYERELRAIIWDTPGGIVRERDGSIRAPVDVGTLVECVYVAPRAEPHVKEDGEKTNDSYGLAVRVQQSELARPPLY
jgi:hypothetical protein